MKSIFNFLSYFLINLLIIPSYIIASECVKCQGKGYHTYRVMELPCGCKNHVYCLLELAAQGGIPRSDLQYKCLNLKCPQKYYFKTGEDFWKYVWNKIPSDSGGTPSNNNYIYIPTCNKEHATLAGTAHSYCSWLKNRNIYVNDPRSYNDDYKKANLAFNNHTLCGICGTSK